VNGEEWLQREPVWLHREQRADDTRDERAGATNDGTAL
jgi:hypothetical protein